MYASLFSIRITLVHVTQTEKFSTTVTVDSRIHKTIIPENMKQCLQYTNANIQTEF